MSPAILILFVTAAVVLVAAVAFAVREHAAGDFHARTNPFRYFCGAFIALVIVATIGEGAVFAIVKLVRYAWGGS